MLLFASSRDRALASPAQLKLGIRLESSASAAVSPQEREGNKEKSETRGQSQGPGSKQLVWLPVPHSHHIQIPRLHPRHCPRRRHRPIPRSPGPTRSPSVLRFPLSQLAFLSLPLIAGARRRRALLPPPDAAFLMGPGFSGQILEKRSAGRRQKKTHTRARARNGPAAWAASTSTSASARPPPTTCRRRALALRLAVRPNCPTAALLSRPRRLQGSRRRRA